MDYPVFILFTIFQTLSKNSLQGSTQDRYLTGKTQAKKTDVSDSPLSRSVSGESKTVMSDIPIGAAEEFKVSAGIHTEPVCRERVKKLWPLRPPGTAGGDKTGRF